MQPPTFCVALSVGSTLFVPAGEMVAVAMLMPEDITSSPPVHDWLVVFSVSSNGITVLLLSVSFRLLHSLCLDAMTTTTTTSTDVTSTTTPTLTPTPIPTAAAAFDGDPVTLAGSEELAWHVQYLDVAIPEPHFGVQSNRSRLMFHSSVVLFV